MKDFINEFYTYDFTWIIHNDDNSDENDFEIDQNLEDNNEKVEASALQLATELYQTYYGKTRCVLL